IGKVNKVFTISDLVFIVAPRVNAAGRMDDARKAVELFIEQDMNAALDYASQLHSDNNDRRDIDKKTTEEALNMLSGVDVNSQLKSTVVYKEDWHKGVVGIVASRLIEHCYRPTIVLTESNGKISGSARSVKGFNLFEGLSECSEYLSSFGGHYFAAGLTMEKEYYHLFKEKFNQVASSILTDEMLIPEIEIDTEISFQDISENFLDILNQFAPHGPENMRPIFMTRNVVNYRNYSRVLKDLHVKYIVSQKGKTMNGIGFNHVDKFPIVETNLPFDMIYHIEENEWNGNKSIQLKVIDIRQSVS
ncbi:MAG: single-stranded-DNA-specific exonuclease RecJ, partial [Flavobacteriales bacterium]|nr:single-stranded-DNA-specific exonuclease RecJ [Flavobacteriales bacterium]